MLLFIHLNLLVFCLLNQFQNILCYCLSLLPCPLKVSVPDFKTSYVIVYLHDLFLYDWHTHAKRTGDHFHGMTHPKRALMNAEKFFDLNSIERDIIINHMWPVTLFSVPRTKEGWITTLADKYCGSFETAQRKESDPVKKKRGMDRIVERFSYLVDTKR